MPNPSVRAEARPASLASLLRGRAAERGERTAFVFLADGEAEGERLTYAGLAARARAIAAALRESLAPGDRALLLYPPGLEFIAAFFGCLQAGVIAVPAYPPRLKDRSQGRLRAIAKDAEPKAALTTGAILEAFATPPNIAHVPELATARWIATDALEGSDAELPDPDPDSVAFLQYTSGSTAAPKGVMVTHANLLHNERMIGAAFRQDEGSVVVGWLPLYHDMGLIGNVLQPLHAGGTCVLMAPVAFLQKPLRWLEAIHRYRGTTSGGPNFAYELCLRRIGEEQRAGLDLSSWRVAYNGAEPVRAETLERFAAAFAPCGFRREVFYPCYGLAEATLFVSGGAAGTAPRVGEIEERPVVSCGHAWEGQRIAIANPESGEEVAAGAVGEIWVSGPSVAGGYWRNPEATAHDFEAKLVTGEGPFLRTGDLGFLSGGELFVTGRIKDLVIIRGRNHYPQDIELTAERSHPDLRPGSGAAFSVEVGGEERLVLVEEVERRRREGFEEVIEAVRRVVAEEHEVQVYDVVLVRVGTVPKTSSGKIQRRATRSLYLEGGLEVVGRSSLAAETPAAPSALVAPSPGSLAALEGFLRERAAAALGVPAAAIDPERPLTALGLDSLAAIELKASVESSLGVTLPLADLLEGAGTAELAASLLARTDTDQHGRTRTETPGPCSGSRLSQGQRALWFLERLAPEGGAYNVAVAARARGLDPAALRRALDALVLRHPALRSVFPLKDDEPVRQVLDHAEVDFTVEDAAGWSEARLADRLAEEAYRPFDLGHGPLLRVRAFERGDGEHALLLSVHHIAVDFASLAVVARDLALLLAGAELEPLPFGVSDFVRWQDEMLAGPRGERLWGYWREALAGLPDLDLPADRPRPPVQTYGGGARTLELPPDLADGVRKLAAKQGATLFTALLAVFQAQLARYSGQEDFAVGSPAAGRPPELAGAVGYFVNPVALRADLAGEPAFATFLDRTRRTVLAGLEHGDFPFALLAERLRPARDPARTPLFQGMFLLQRARPGEAAGIATFVLGESGGRIDLAGLELESLRLEERRAQFDLTLRAVEEAGGRLRASLEFNADLFDAATAGRMLGHFRTLLAGAVEHPDRPVARLPLLAPEEREQALVAWNVTAAGHRKDALLHGLFEEQATRTPDAEALVDGSARLTYAELNHRADELARRLRSLGVGPETRVGVKLGRSADLVVSLLGVLKAGGAYVPLDLKYPGERLALMLEDSGARVVIDHRTDLTDLTDRSDRRSDRSDQPVLPGNLAYLIYTSGSTGRPKAVAIEHRSAALMVQWARGVFSPGELAGVLASTSVAFDLSVFEIFVPLAWGGRVILAENALELPRLPAAGEVTLVNTVPSALAELVRGDGMPPSVRTVNLAGEPIPPALADAVHGLPGGVRLYNLYGPSEDTTYSTWTRIAPGDAVTIGRPVDETRAYVLDAHGEPLPVGVPGELLLGGGGLARGYLGRPELTAERFVPDPFGEAGGRLYRTGDLVRRRADGDLDFLGRIDHQVKIRGFRVELGEVEAALAAHPAVREAVVLALPEPLPEPESGRRLAAFLVLGEEVEPAALRGWLQERLPDAFIPTGWRVLDALPLSPNGKVDRKALAHLTPEPEVSEGAEPRTPVERALADLVAAALGVADIGLHDDFFALGGHSLLAARIASQASRRFGVDLPVSALFQAPTVAALAGRIAAAAGGAEIRPHEGRDGLPLSFAQQRLWFLDRLQPGGAAYNMPGAAELEGGLDVDALAAALTEVVRRHEALRTRFVVHGGEPVQVVDPPDQVALEIVDLTGRPENEADARMQMEAAAPFDLSRGPLFRATLLRLAPERHRLLLTLHHMVADGWSLGVLLGELAALYGRNDLRASLPELPVQYADWVVWQRHRLAGAALDRQLAWWKDELAGAPTTLELPADRPRPAVRTQRGGTVRAALPGELADGVRALARRRGATPFMALLAAFQTLLLRVTGQDDLLVGSVVAGRTRPEIEGLIGFFANTLVLRGDLTGDPSFLDALEQARRRTAGAWAHQDLPVERLVEELQPGRELGLSPLFQVVFVLQSAPAALALPGLAVRRLPVASGTAKFDLTLEITEQEGGLAAAWELSRDLFDEPTVERMAGWFARLLAGAVETPERRLSDLPLLGEAELRQLLVEQNPSPTKAPLDVPVHRLFEVQAAREPQRIALVLEDRELSYGELNERADRLARRLAAEGVGPEILVGVLLERSFEMIEAFLAILKAGGAYVPLDPSWPSERLNDLIDEAGIRFVVDREFLADPDPHPLAPSPTRTPWPPGEGEAAGRLAYAMFTSGSTGRPKTVGIEHGSIVRLVRDTDFADFGPDHVFLQLAAPAFDAATLEIWGALLHGARLVLYPAATPSLDELGEVLARHGVTTLWLTAGLFHQVVESRIGILRGVRQLLAGGDVLAPAAVGRVLAELPGTRLINGYGPTENTTFTCCHTVVAPVPPGRSVPIGRPIAGTEVYVVDPVLRPVPALVPGELVAGGAGLARGYLGRPDLTAERFVPDPFGRPGSRLYRTGDLVRRLPSGEIEFLGRIDRQVKIRGFRVEPGEVEAVLAGHPAVAQAAVLVREVEPGDRRLVAFVVFKGDDDLRSWLGERLPAYLIPALVVLPELPLTANGKVDRRALERIAPGAPERAALDAPRTPVEELIAGIWAEVLGVERVGIHDDFFELGGHSLLATRAVSRIVDTLQVDLPLSTFFEAPTVAGLGERLFGVASRAAAPSLVPVPRDAPLPLSFAQQRLWFLHQLEPDSPAYHVSGALRLTGPLRAGWLERALGEIVRRHEALRTVFLETEAGPVQRILPGLSLRIPVVDLRGLPGREDEAERLGLAEARRLFDLTAGPVLRAQLLRLDDEEHLLVVVLHHIASDGWSLGVMIGELAALYTAFATDEPSLLPELALQYADFAEWQRRTLRGRYLERQIGWWRAQLADPPVLDLPADRPRPPVPSGRGRNLPVALPENLTDGLQALARREGVTLYMVLLAAYATLLGRWSGQDDLTVGSPIANRDRQEIEPLIGCFVNTLTLRVRLAGDPGFRELLARVREMTLGAYDHQGVPFERLVEELAPERDRAHAPLFQVMLVLQNAPLPPLRVGPLVLERRELPTGTAKFDLTLALAEEAGGIAGVLEHSADLFETATAARLMGHLAELLRGAVDDPGQVLSGLPLLTAAERGQILGAWNDTAAMFEGERAETLLLSDLVAAQAARTPGAEAVAGWRLRGEERLTYAELLDRADRLAGHLAALGVGPEARVGVCIDRTADLPVALLAVLRAGGAYVPLDPAYPRERLEFMLRDSGADVLVTQSDLAGRCGPFAGAMVWLDRTDPDDLPDPVDMRRALPGNLAYLIYTSGSTGLPKAVAVEHRSAVAMVQWALDAFSSGELAGVLFSTSVCFDLSVFELFVPLAAGGKVLVAANALELPSLPYAGEVTMVNTVPSAMTELVRGEGFPASVHTVNLAGEPLKGALVDAVHERPGVRRVVNLYGPSEDTTYSTWETIPPSSERMGEPLIGRPVANTRVYLLDRSGNLVPEGVPGELLLAGAGLARGYIGRPDLTAERFVPDPFGMPASRLYRTGDLARWRPGGRLEYLGRIDHQVKVRGFRIELGEIEAALVRHPAVGEVAVLARDDEGRGKILVAFLVRREGMEGADLRPLALRQLLRRSLPEHMVPGAWVELPALPLTPNGKVDRRTLGRLRFDAGTGRQGTVAPRTPTEELLAALWCEVLGRDRVGVHDSFFELGGHSLLATRLVSRVRATFGRELPLARLFAAPTIAELARLLDEARGGVARSAPILPAPRQGDLPLSFAQERLWFLDRIQPGAAYNVPLALRLRGTLDAGRLGAAFGAIAARHEALRTVFVESDGEPAQRILPAAPVEDWPLPVVDLSASAEELPGLAEADALRPFDLANGPLLRTTLLRLGDADHVLLLNMHHIVSDGWSLGVLLRELTAFYGGDPGSLPELPVQYADFAVWQKDWLRGEELERQMSYWRRQLAGVPAALDLPLDRPRPLMATTNGARRPVVLAPALTGELTALARRQGATTFMLLLAAWVTLLHRVSNQADLNVGTPIAGRNRAETEGLVGFFVNTLVMRAELTREGTGGPAFPDLLAQIRGTALAAYDHQDLPFEKLVDELRPQRDMSHQPLFQVMFALQNAPLGALELPGLTLEPTELGATVAKFDLTLNLMELDGRLTGSLEYNTDLFDATTAARLAGHLGVLLEGIAGDPERSVAELPLLTAEEAHQLLVEWGQVRQEPLALCLHEIVEHQTDSVPEATAVEHEEIAWSYRDLDQRANRLAWTLRELGVGPEVRVALVMERTADMIVAMLGVLKAGGAYVPLDPAHPLERLAFLLEDCKARVLLTHERMLAGLPETAVRILCLDRDREEIARRPEHRPASGVTAQSPAYMIYTSGSTGAPKGVLIPHHAVVTYIRACADVYGNGPGDRTLQFASISFDPSVEEIFCTLSRGATLVIRGEVQEGIAEFVERLRTRRITQLEVPTAFWHQMAAGMEAESLSMPPDLRVLFAGGERMQARRLASWWRLVGPGFRLINAYGPTETTIAATLCPFPGEVAVDAGLREVPIGRPLPHVRAYVLDRWLRPVPIGVVGELCLGGFSLSRGYLDRPELTAARFIPNPFVDPGGDPGERLYRTGDLVRLLPGGLLEFVGRTDHQVKLRGYRIELGEIESVLAAHPALREVAVVTRREASEDVQLVAWAEVRGEAAEPTPAELRVWLEERLPSYMVPAAIQVLPALPLNANGKVDRQALERCAPQAKERTAFTAPRNELEEAIAAVWRDVFGLDEPDALGIHENFFDAGGSSLLLVKLHSRLQTALGRNFPLVEMFKHPTIAALAASLGAEAPAQPSLDKARARTETRRTSMRQMQQLREERRRGR